MVVGADGWRVTFAGCVTSRRRGGETESTRSRGSLEPAEPAAGPILAARNLEVVYQDVVLVLRGVSLEVPRGEIVALLGANGAGKTTLLRAITGLLPVHRGRITKGSVHLDGDRIDGRDPAAIVRRGVAQVMEGRRIFAELTVDENLRAGAFTVRSRAEIRDSFDRVVDLFPRLGERRRSTAGYLSGGEQQMLAIGRALMADPRLLLLDEPSLGLAPRLVEAIRDTIVELNRQGTSVLLVEQNAAMALAIASHGYVMETGRVVKDGPAQELLGDEDIQEFYLGVGETGRRSFRDVKSYRRRKRWAG
jgi:branched-chain amino acid transport system ATP-binding protein